MNKNLDLIAKDLYAKISSYPNLVMRDAEGNDVETDQVEGARKFNFEYEVADKNLATITISLNDNDENQDAFEVLISNDPADGSDEYAKKLFLVFGRQMREFAKQHLLTFNIHVATRSNKERDIGESIMSESKLFGTAKTSYQRIGEATLIIKHRDAVNQENPAGRAQRIESIYVENSVGERFKYPHKHLNGARAMAQHVAHGGNPYDGIGQYMVGLSEELVRLRMFKGYVDRNDAISEAMGNVQSKVLERIDQVKKQIQHLQRPNMYEEFAEGFTEQETAAIPEDLMNDWIDRLTIRTFNEELKGVFPYIFRLISEDDIPIKELGLEDFVSEDSAEEDDDSVSDESVIPEFAAYESYLNRMVESEQEGIFAAANEDALAELNELLSREFSLGIDGTNAVQSLEGLGFDEDFLDGLKKMGSDETGAAMDVRPFVKEYVQQKDAELGTDVFSQLEFGEDDSVPETPQLTPEPETGMQPAPAPAPGVNPEATPSPEMGMNPATVPPQQNPIAEAMARESRGRVFDELKEFIGSMYNEDEGNFPKGTEGVKIACEKKFGDRVGVMAAKIVERMTAIGEMRRIKELSGQQQDPVNEISIAKKMAAYSAAQDPEADYAYGDKVIDQADRIRDKIVRKHGEKMGRHADAKADADHFGRKDASGAHKGYAGQGDRLSKSMRGKPGDYRTTKSGKMHGSDANALKSRIKSAAHRPAPKPNLPEEGDTSGYSAYEQLKDKISGVLARLYDKGHDKETIGQMRDRIAAFLKQDPEDDMFVKAFMSVFNDQDLDGELDADDYTDRSMRRGERGMEEADKHSVIGKIQRGHELKKKVDSTFKDIGTAQKKGDHPEASKAFRKHERYANLERPGTWTKTKDEGVAEDSELTAMLRIAGLR